MELNFNFVTDMRADCVDASGPKHRGKRFRGLFSTHIIPINYLAIYVILNANNDIYTKNKKK